MIQTLKNDILTVSMDTKGAELQSISDNRTGHQYLYQGNSRYWARRSPVLFPIVGAVWEGKFRMDGTEFQMGQHGFARDKEFAIIECEAEDEAWFSLESDETTLSLYPRRFRLEIGYGLNGERLTVMWRVFNLDTKEMVFQIGAHPAFNYPEFNASDSVHGYLLFDRTPGSSQLLKEKGCFGDDERPVALDSEGMIPVIADTFDIDTIVIADSGIKRISLLDKHRMPYLSVFFTAPLFGIWSPSPEAPFVCIEPWYGRADKIGFADDFSRREFVCTLGAGERFEASYMITFDNI